MKKINQILTLCVMGGCLFGLSAGCWLKPSTEYSYSERRELKQLPELKMNRVMSGRWMSDFESYTQDQFLLRDRFRTLKAVTAMNVFMQKDNHGIYLYEGYASGMVYPMNETAISQAGDRFGRICEKYFEGTDVKVYMSMIPDKNYFMAEEQGMLSLDYEEFAERVREETPYMEYIDIFPLLTLEDYYKTDTHWRQECIIDVAEAIGEAMGSNVTGEDAYTLHRLDNPFYGVYYGQSALPLEPDELMYVTSDMLENCVVYDYENGIETTVYDMELAYGKDPYEMFLGGSVSLLEIQNPDGDPEKELIIFRDSFGSSISPLLVEDYSKVTLVDIRYLSSEYLDQFITFDNQDVLFLYSTLVLNSEGILK